MSDFIICHWPEILILVTIILSIWKGSSSLTKWKVETAGSLKVIDTRLIEIKTTLTNVDKKYEDLNKRVYDTEGKILGAFNRIDELKGEVALIRRNCNEVQKEKLKEAINHEPNCVL